MVWLIEGIYVSALAVGFIWLIIRIRRYIRSASARKETEAQWVESFSEDQFQAFLESLRQKRDSQATPQNEKTRSDDRPSD